MSRRRFFQNKKLKAIPLVCPEDFEVNIQNYLAEEQMVNIVEEFDNIQRSEKKYCYAVHNNIPRYWRYNADGSINIRKNINEHEFPNTDGIAIVSETLGNGDVVKSVITLTLGTRSRYQFKENSTHRWVCICQNSLNGYIPMDTLWYFLGYCTSTNQAEYYSNYCSDDSGDSSIISYNTINYAHIKSDLEIIPNNFLYNCKKLKGGFKCPDSIITIGSNAFYYSSISYIKFGEDNKSKLKTINTLAFANCSSITDATENNFLLPIGVEVVEKDVFRYDQGYNLCYCNLRIPYTCKVFKGLNDTDAYGFIINKLIISGTHYTLGGFGVRGTNYLKEIEIEDIGDLPNYYYLDKSGNCLYFDNRGDDTIPDSEKMKVLIASLGNADFSDTDYPIIEEGTTHLEIQCLSSFRTNVFPSRDLCGRELIIPKSVKYIYRRAIAAENYTCVNPFKDNDNLISIDIGESKITGEVDDNGLFFLSLGKSVQSIVNFSPNINYYIIDSENEYLSDYEGVLYNGDKTTLIIIPKLYSGLNNSGIFNIPSSVKSLSLEYPQNLNIKEIIWNDDGGEYKMEYITNVGNAVYFRNWYNVESFISPKKLMEVRFSPISTRVSDKFNEFTFNYKVKLSGFSIMDINSLKRLNCIDNDGNFITEPNNIETHYFSKNGILYQYNNTNKFIYLWLVPSSYENNIDIMEGTYAFYNDSVYWFRRSSLFKDKVLILPSTLCYLCAFTHVTNSNYFKEIHIHRIEPPQVWGNEQNVKLTKESASNPRFVHVPINALGHHSSQSDKGYNSVGCWCSVKNHNINYISDLYYDLILLQGTITNADGTPYIGEFTLTNTSAKSTILKEINVTTNEEGKYEVWCENLEYVESLTNSTNQIVNVNGLTEPLSDTAHIVNFNIQL